MVKNLGRNKTQLTLGNVNILVSYETPVAVFVPGRGYLQTKQKFSRTTSKHINEWIGNNPSTKVSQQEIESFMQV